MGLVEISSSVAFDLPLPANRLHVRDKFVIIADRGVGGATRFQHPKIGEQSIEIGYMSFPAQKPGNTAPMIFEQHGLMCR